MAPHTITPVVRTVSLCAVKAGLKRSPRGHHARTRLSLLPKLNLDSSLKTTWFHLVAVQSLRAQSHSKQKRSLPKAKSLIAFLKDELQLKMNTNQNVLTADSGTVVDAVFFNEKLTVRCALWAGGIIVPYFFKNDEGHNVTVNGDRYRAMITNFFIPELNNHHVQELWFQQDGATCHTARATIDLLKDTFGDRLISRFGPVNWPPRSCDLTPLDYFLWGYVKSLVYADKPQTLTIWKATFAVLLPIYGHKCWKKSHRKLDVQIGLHPSQPWQSYARNHI
ncbi:uncharacterized protein TNCV_3257201 [Trichonephila clavipes]|nr:uncharacterized protein TNCV_3257201 [Trichonephila clavipes]